MNIKTLKDISPLRYPGSKQKLAKYLEKILAFNSMNPEFLVEPFVGGGSVFLYFLFNNIVNKVIISDKDKLVYSFWKVLFTDPNILIKFIEKVNVNLENFYFFKNIAINESDYSETDLAKSCLFLNRTSFSGILTNQTGPIGGKYQKSNYKVDCRFNRATLIDKISFISTFSEKVIVINKSWEEAIRYSNTVILQSHHISEAFYYLDPPFFLKAKDLYRIYFNRGDHEKLCSFLNKKKFHWLLSYDNNDEIKKIYAENYREPIHIEMPYSINSHSRRIEKEIIITPLAVPTEFKN